MVGTRVKGLQVRYALLAAILAASVVYQAAVSLDLIDQWTHPSVQFATPFTLLQATRVIAQVGPVGAEAGLRPGDEVIRVNGQPLNGYSLLARQGQRVVYTIRRNGLEQDIQLERAVRPQQLSDAQMKLLTTVLVGVMPWLCLLLGGWAVAIRPRDPQAWLLLALLLSFPHMVDNDASRWENDALRIFALGYHRLLAGIMPLSMVLFALYFTNRFPLDQRLPWLKWVVLMPGALSGAALTVLALLFSESLDAAASLSPVLGSAGAVFSVTMFLSISVFFMVMGWKFGITTQPDARRRLKMLLYGAMAAMSPLFVIIVASLATGRSPVTFAPPWMLTIALLTLFLFPATITYVIVVHRALDVRVVVRQGIQYALARGGARILFAVAGVGVLLYSITLALDESVSRPQKYRRIGMGVLGLFLLQRLRLKLAGWIDRKFFRQAYDAERILSELSDEVRTVVDEASLLERVGRAISDALYVPRLAFLVADGVGAYRPAYAVGYETPPVVSFPDDAATVKKLRDASEPAQVYLDDEQSWVYRTPEMTAAERRMLATLESQLILPLAVKEKLVGFISLGRKKSEEPYSGSDLRLLRSLASQTGLALENSRLAAAIAHETGQRERLNREVEIAREVQQRLFPQKTPTADGIDCAGGCRPALAVGGDYYDFLELPEERLGIVIGDVSGKGIAAALLMAGLQASVRGQLLHEASVLATVVGRVNTLIYESSTASRYATLFYAQLDTKTLALDYVNAGHNPPLLLRASGEVEHLDVGGTVVGLLPRFPYQQGRAQLARGDVMVLFTDGISEAMNSADDEWGEEKLIEAMRNSNGRNAADLIPYIIEEADKFVAGAPQHDDMTLVIVRIL